MTFKERIESAKREGRGFTQADKVCASTWKFGAVADIAVSKMPSGQPVNVALQRLESCFAGYVVQNKVAEAERVYNDILKLGWLA